jgi:HD-GYP domain-containing protein (c-di-GMP phosphodiesterase class II)
VRDRPIVIGIAAWAVVWVGLLGLQLGISAASDRPIGSALALFWVVVVAASGCVVTSCWMIWRGHRDDVAELGLIGGFAFAVSVLPLVHGLTVPGVLYGPNDAVMSSVASAIPLGTLAAAPLLLTSRHRRRLLRWRRWVGANVALQTALAIVLLCSPSLLPVPAPGTAEAVALAVATVAACLAFSIRHLRLYRIGRHASVLAVSLGFALVAASNLVWVNAAAMSAGFWSAHLFDITGVFAMTIVGAVAHRRGEVERSIFRPLTVRDPLEALELGLDPVVRRFVADLESKDPITADHVRRTSEVAISLGERLGLGPEELRLVGLGALLHDVGKLELDDEVLHKPGRLTDDEFEHVKTHTVLGEELVRGSSVLAGVAPIIRHHHERVDGRGYPDGLAGTDVPLLARIVSVCDAFDAMAHTRQYRAGMELDRVRSVLREHAGAQWDASIVRSFLDLLDEGAMAMAPTVLADVGRVVCASHPTALADIAGTERELVAEM